MTRLPPHASAAATARRRGALAVLCLNLIAPPAAAAESETRDPMRPPAQRSAAAATGRSDADETPPVQARHLMIVDGRRWVVDRGRRFGVGDLLDGARIESIEESAVVLRGASGPLRLPLYGKAIKRVVEEPKPARPAAAVPAYPARRGVS